MFLASRCLERCRSQSKSKKKLSQHISLKACYIAMRGSHHPKVIAHILAGRSEKGKHSANSGLRQGSIKDLRVQQKRHSPFLFHWLNDFRSNLGASIESSGDPVYDEGAVPVITDHQDTFIYFCSGLVQQAQNESHSNHPQTAESSASIQPLFTPSASTLL